MRHHAAAMPEAIMARGSMAMLLSCTERSNHTSSTTTPRVQGQRVQTGAAYPKLVSTDQAGKTAVHADRLLPTG